MGSRLLVLDPYHRTVPYRYFFFPKHWSSYLLTYIKIMTYLLGGGLLKNTQPPSALSQDTATPWAMLSTGHWSSHHSKYLPDPSAPLTPVIAWPQKEFKFVSSHLGNEKERASAICGKELRKKRNMKKHFELSVPRTELLIFLPAPSPLYKQGKTSDLPLLSSSPLIRLSNLFLNAMDFTS